MSWFAKHQKPGHTARKQQTPTTHTETVTASAAPKISPFMHAQTPNPRKFHAKKALKQNEIKASRSPTAPAQKSRKRASQSQQRLESDSGGDDDDEDNNDVSDHGLDPSRKKARRGSDVEPDLNRNIRSRKAFSDEDGGEFPMIHGSNIASLSKPMKFKAAFPDDQQAIEIQLQYPSASQKESFELVVPLHNDDFKTLEDIREVMEIITSNYLPNDRAATLTNDSTGLLRRIKRAVERRAGSEYMDHIQEWNELLLQYRDDGLISKAMDEWKAIDLKLLERILTQTYSRTVSPRVHELRQYQNGTDNVYGELLPKFVSTILKKDTKMKSDHIFVDLGSGVGNCVLQAALEVGCESWGCEMMENACDLAELQVEEFEARCRLWGLSMGDIHLERGDFLKNDGIRKVLQRADVVLVNNQAFTPSLNEDLTNLFLDLKEGAKVVSLKSFVPAGNKNQVKNSGATYNVLDAVEKRYYSACVSWTDAPGTYYVSTKDSSRVKTFA